MFPEIGIIRGLYLIFATALVIYEACEFIAASKRINAETTTNKGEDANV